VSVSFPKTETSLDGESSWAGDEFPRCHSRDIAIGNISVELFRIARIWLFGRMETTMAASEEEWIKHRAYQLWEQEGYPSGKDQEHWERAKLEYATQKPIASEKAPSKLKAPAAKSSAKAATPIKTAATKTASKAAPKTAKTSSSKSPAAKPAAAKSQAVKAKPADKTEAKAKAAAASATPEQTKKRPRKVAAE
jgi:hypothetical protein